MADRRYRLLFVAPTGFFADYGCHVRIRGHAQALQARGHHVVICTYPGGRDLAGMRIVRPSVWPRGREMPVGSSWLKLALDAILTPTVLATAARYRPDLIHAYLHEGALIGAPIARLLRVPLVLDFQGSLTAEMVDHRFISTRSPLLGLLRAMEQRINLRPDAVLASSHHAARLLSEEFAVPEERVVPLPDSVDATAFDPAAAGQSEAVATLRDRLGIPAGRPVVVYLGLLAEYQGTDLLLRTAVKMNAKPSALPVHFLIMGFPWVEHYRRRAQELGISDRVTLTGKVPYEDAATYLALGDVAVAPKLSSTEGSGKLLNYMAMALPTAAFDTKVHREYLTDLGMYAAPGDSQALAEAIARLLQNRDEATRRGEALRERARLHYSWTAAASRIEDVYEHLLRERTSAQSDRSSPRRNAA